MKFLRWPQILLFAVLVLTTGACQKNISGEIDEVIVPPVKETVQTSIQGRILDEHELPLAGASVTCGGKDTTTDVNGNFLLENVTVSEDAAVVGVSKTQYISGNRTLVVNPNSLHYVQIMLYEQQATATFSSTGGGTVNLPEGVLTVPANNVLQENNTAYSGIADVNYKYINPENDRFSDVMPGDLRGINKAKKQLGLQCFGMMALELSGQNGEKLHLSKPVTIKIAIPGSLQNSAPAQTPLWFFNVTSGYWEEDGVATRQGDFYVANVKNPGFWQCAATYDLVKLQTKIVDQHNLPVPNVRMVIQTKLDFIPVYSYTGADGIFTGKVPVNAQLIIAFTNPCKDLFFQQETGPFSTASIINNLRVELPANNTLVINGIANNCINQPVQKGMVCIMVDGLQYATAIENGHYTMSIIRCNPTATNVTFMAKDAATNASTLTTINANNGTLTPTLVVCTP